MWSPSLLCCTKCLAFKVCLSVITLLYKVPASQTYIITIIKLIIIIVIVCACHFITILIIVIKNALRDM